MAAPHDCPIEDRLRHAAAGSHTHTIVDGEPFERQMGVVCDRLEDLSDKVASLHEGQAAAMAQAMRSVMTDRETLSETMGILLVEAKRKAAEQTGQAVGGFLRTVLIRGLVIGLLVLTVAKLAGVEVAAKVWGAVKGMP